MADSGSSNALEDISKCIKRHDEALEALKEVLSILKKLAETVGGDNNQPIKKADWSLGLSDDENDQIDEDSDANKIINDGDNEESEDPNGELDELLKDVEKSIEFGPALLPNVMNAEIWRQLPSQAKVLDIKQQQIQEVISLGLSSLASIANTVAMNKGQMDIVDSVVKQSLDGANLLGDLFQSISGRRRYDLKKFLNPEYSGICSAQLPGSEWLFGADLAENLKSSKATSSLMRNTMNKTMRYTPYSNPRQSNYNQGARPSTSLNWNRPFYNQQSRGNGQHQRFERRPQGSFRFQTPGSFQSQRLGIPEILVSPALEVIKFHLSQFLSKSMSPHQESILLMIFL
ncbi:hypothetical protein Fcan01_25141 [Folsomia candida]|uniref:Uncharacterized protein n=1 Tax=Folsomia candida TaxID=158441 RepID=A0A226D3B9_FOLCA|nr:hypothetical protein Fcan01_25141 [Folsomia candida]